MSESHEHRMTQRARALLTESAAQLDAETRRRLSQARYAALDALPAKRRFSWRYAASGVAAAVVATWMATWWLLPADAPSSPPFAEQALADLELLTGDGPDFYAELEFYEWLADPNHAG